MQFTTNFEVKSQVYDLSKARHSCRSEECSFELEYGSDEAEVIVTPDTNVVSVPGQCCASAWFLRFQRTRGKTCNEPAAHIGVNVLISALSLCKFNV